MFFFFILGDSTTLRINLPFHLVPYDLTYFLSMAQLTAANFKAKIKHLAVITRAPGMSRLLRTNGKLA